MFKKFWDHFEEIILVVSYVVMLAILTVQVFTRYVFNYSFTWAEELARFVFIWQIWLGASYGVKKNRNIRIDVFTHKLSPKVKKVYEIIITIISMVFCGFFLYKGIEVVKMIVKLKQLSGAMRLPMQFVYASVPVCCALMLIHFVEHIVKTIKGEVEINEGDI